MKWIASVIRWAIYAAIVLVLPLDVARTWYFKLPLRPKWPQATPGYFPDNPAWQTQLIVNAVYASVLLVAGVVGIVLARRRRTRSNPPQLDVRRMHPRFPRRSSGRP